jgi:uncharacterized protein with PQ loop repeat
MAKREEISKKLRWPFIIWLVGFVNVAAMLPQLYQIITTKNVAGLSVSMFVIYMVIQVAFSIEGYFKRNNMLMVCMGLSALVSASIIGLVAYLRYLA